jgi:hypothetical protein
VGLNEAAFAAVEGRSRRKFSAGSGSPRARSRWRIYLKAPTLTESEKDATSGRFAII